jgi:hypothetical protein
MKSPHTTYLAGLLLALLSSGHAEEAQITVQANQITNTLSPHLSTGACIEDVNHEVYGGIYSQMIFGESFQEPKPPIDIQGFERFGSDLELQDSVISYASDPSIDGKLIWDGPVFSQVTVGVEVLRPSNTPGIAGLILNVQEPGNGIDQFIGYEISLNGAQLVLGRHRNNWEPIATYPCPTPTDQWISLVVQVSNDVLKITVNGQLIATYQDQANPLGAGRVGLRSVFGGASFRNLSVSANGQTTQIGFVAAGNGQAISRMWKTVQQGSGQGTYDLVTANPFLGVQSQSFTFTGGVGEIGIANASLNGWGMNFENNQIYNGLIWVKSGQPTDLFVSAESSDGSVVYAERKLRINEDGWQKLEFTIVPRGSDRHGRFAIKLKSPGSVTVGYVFLEPGSWGLFRGLPVRKDIVKGLIDQGITVLRYGGSMINSPQYHWKNMIGPRDLRPPYDGTWYPYSSNGWGIFDFLNLCEATGFLGIPALNSNETPQDMADFVQYVNGPSFTKWGSKRAADGHPAPYNIEYFEFGNEERIDDTYWQKFQAVAQAVWAADPNVTIVVGDFSYSQPIQDPFHFTGALSGITTLEAHQKILELARQNNRQVWFDVHIGTDGPGADPGLIALPTYVSALNQIGNGARHKVVVFELNANNHEHRRALGNALANNAISRIADALPIVTSANCLQPDGQNDNGWDQGLLFFNPSQVWLQPPGYVTQMLSRSYQPILVNSQVQSSSNVLDVTAKRSTDGKTLVLQVVNLSDQSVLSAISLSGFRPSSSISKAEELAGPLNGVNTAQRPNQLIPTESVWRAQFVNDATNYTFKPYSFTVLTFH